MVFVNQRFIKNNHLHEAVLAAFENLLPEDTHPLYAIFIELDPARIDINVHPTKQSIKFEDFKLVYDYLRVTIRHALGQHNITPTLDFEQEMSFTRNPTNAFLIEPEERKHPESESNSAKSFDGNTSSFGGNTDYKSSVKNW